MGLRLGVRSGSCRGRGLAQHCETVRAFGRVRQRRFCDEPMQNGRRLLLVSEWAG